MFDDPYSMSRLIIAITTLPFIIILTIINLVLVRGIRKATASRRWSGTDGQISSSQVTSHRSSSSNGTHTTIYEPHVTYQYNVNGQNHVGSQIDFGAIGGSSMQGWSEQIVEKYPAGKAVTVYYNPVKAEESVLDHTGKAGCTTGLLLILGGVELLLIVFLVLSWTPLFVVG